MSSDNAGHQLTIRILIGMALGLIVGLLINFTVGAPDSENPQWAHVWLSNGLFQFMGRAFVQLLQVLVVPLVFVSLVCGTAALEDIRQVGRVGAKTVGFYLLTTAMAITLAMGMGLLVRPGANFPQDESVSFAAKEAPPLVDVLIGIFPRNIVDAMASGDMLPIIVFAILLGIAAKLAGQAGARVLDTMQDLNEVVMKLVWLVMAVAPFGVFGLIAKTFATQGFDAIRPLAMYFVTVLGVLLIHALITYPVLLKLLSGLNPIQFLRQMWETQVFAFSTASSNATIPITLRTVNERLGVSKGISSFTIPLGATINMDGTAIMQGVATIFIAQVYAVDLTMGQLLTVVLTATLASIGTAGVPGVGLIMLAMVLRQVGLPVEAIGLIVGIDRLLDMTRTAVNVTGDAAVTCIVAKAEGQIDEARFNEADTRQTIAKVS